MVSYSRFARLLQLQVTPSGPSFFAISRARGRLAVKVSSSKKNSFTCGKRVHVLNHLAFGVVNDFALRVPEGEPVDGFERAAFGDFFAGEIKFLAANPINSR